MKTRPLAYMIWILATALWAPAHAQTAKDQPRDTTSPQYRMTDVTFHSGDIAIVATLFVPAGEGPWPGAVLIQGAGESSRKNVWSLKIAEQLALRGIAVLVPDKRGAGDSEGDWKTATFGDLALDIRAAAEHFAGRTEIDGEKVGVVGLSQGGFYAPIVAESSRVVSFVAGVSSSMLPFEETVNHEMANTFRQQGLTGTAFDQAMDVQVAAVRYARSGNWKDYETKRTMAIQGEEKAARAAADFPARPDHWLWSWVGKALDFDPLPHWQHVMLPTFFAYGEADEQDNVPVSASISRIRSHLAPNHDVTIHVYPESGHALYDPVIAEEKGEGEIRTDFANDLADWIKNRVQRQPGRD